MSVTLEEYCGTSQSKFAEALKLALMDAVFTWTDELEFIKITDRVEARISIMYSISLIDFRLLLDDFRDFYWWIEPSVEVYTFHVVVDLKSNMI